MQKITNSNFLEVYRKNPNIKLECLDINWIKFIIGGVLPISLIEKLILFVDNHHLRLICGYQILPMWFIKKYYYKFHIDEIIRYQKVSDSFIVSHLDSYIAHLACETQKLSESTILKILKHYRSQLTEICQYQKLRNLFIKKHFNIFFPEWPMLLGHQELSSDLIDLINQKIHPDEIIGGISAASKNREKLSSSPYKIEKDKYGEYIIAYKAVRIDGYSLYNFQYKYQIGKTYFSACDYREHVFDSWGLSAWTLENAIKYGKSTNKFFKILKIKIYVSDIAVILPHYYNYKLRVRSFTVLSKQR